MTALGEFPRECPGGCPTSAETARQQVLQPASAVTAAAAVLNADIVMFARGVIYMRSVPVDWLSAAAEFASLSHHLLGQRIGTDSP